MDRGIATEANLAWLRANEHRYLVVSREQTRIFDESGDAVRTETSSSGNVDVYTEHAARKEADGTGYRETLLRCHSEARERKERGILDRFRERFESALNDLNAGLSRPRAQKGLEQVNRRIGRIQRNNRRVSRYYDVTVTPDGEGKRAVSVSWTLNTPEGSMLERPGVYCLRSNITDWDAEAMWRTYSSLTEIEAVFRSLKSELGLRPLYHRKQERADGHLFISVLAYQAVQVLRARMKRNGMSRSWASVRNTLRPLQRTTTSFRRKDGGTLHVRKTASPDGDQAEIFRAMGIPPPPRNVRKTVA